MSRPIKYLDIKEFVDLGLLQEVNRRFFHPIGLALEVRQDDDGNFSLSGIWDDRGDPEGTIFGDRDGTPYLPRPEAIATYDNMVKAGSRQVHFGWVIQPPSPPKPQTTFSVVKGMEMPKSLGAVPEGHPYLGEREP